MYSPDAALVRMVEKSIGTVTYVKYPGAMASVTGLMNTPNLSFLAMRAMISSTSFCVGGPPVVMECDDFLESDLLG